MKQSVRPGPDRPLQTPESAVPLANPSSSLEAARLRGASDETAETLLATIRARLREVATFTKAEDVQAETDADWSKAASHAPNGLARLPSTGRWGVVAEAYRAAAAAVARGDLVQAASRLRDAEHLDARTRRAAPWTLPELVEGAFPRMVPRAFATPRDVPPDISALADQIALREGRQPRPGVLEDLEVRPESAPEPEDNDDLD